MNTFEAALEIVEKFIAENPDAVYNDQWNKAWAVKQVGITLAGLTQSGVYEAPEGFDD